MKKKLFLMVMIITVIVLIGLSEAPGKKNYQASDDVIPYIGRQGTQVYG